MVLSCTFNTWDMFQLLFPYSFLLRIFCFITEVRGNYLDNLKGELTNFEVENILKVKPNVVMFQLPFWSTGQWEFQKKYIMDI